MCVCVCVHAQYFANLYCYCTFYAHIMYTTECIKLNYYSFRNLITAIHMCMNRISRSLYPYLLPSTEKGIGNMCYLFMHMYGSKIKGIANISLAS